MAPQTRPRLHFTAKSGWINDPHGLTFRDGRYHLFFQHVPGSTVWRPDCRWGHAVSDNLVEWEEMPIALSPGDGDDGVWSGSLTRDEGGETIAFYTSIQVPDFDIGRIRVARPSDRTWTAWDKDEVVVELPEGLDAVAFRDPFVFRDGDKWRMLVGTALRDGTAAAASFSSPDRLTWTYDGLAAARSGSDADPVWTGALWECPQLFEVDGRSVLVTSVWDDDVLHYTVYAIGDYEDGRFHIRQWHRLTYGDSYYAPSFFRDRDGQPCLVFWLRGVFDEQRGWAGAHSVAYRLSIANERLVMQVHPEVRRYLESVKPQSLEDQPALKMWRLTDGDLYIDSGSASVAVLHRRNSAIRVAADGHSLVLPNIGDNDASVLIDGPIVELCCGTSLFAIGGSADLEVRWSDPD